MRIVGGKYGGRTFTPGKSFKARPTTDIAKEGLFNILNNTMDFSSIKLLDLFAGSGSISYEFISRGCTDVTMIELNFKHLQFIKSVLKELEEKAIVYRADVFRFLKKDKKKYDMIFADPPYDHPQFMEVPKSVFQHDRLTENGIFILEHPQEFDFSKHEGFKETRKYGKVNFSFFGKV